MPTPHPNTSPSQAPALSAAEYSLFNQPPLPAAKPAPAQTPEQPEPALTQTQLPTPLGPMLACATAEGICLLEFTDRPTLDAQLLDLTQRLGALAAPGTNPHFETLRAQLAEYFAGTRQVFTVPLLTPGTEFQQAVWAELQRIPYGRTRSYGQQANALQRPAAVRAVAAANGQNRLAILIPCHRVIGADGKLTGYAGGLWRKQRLLALERQHHLPAEGFQTSLL
ncbi:methylated-DNA--[protein]-cysteine S-methyltransferase [Hymenobacter sp. CRA2]|uniref:methylated-DNA--[protein]-cysteine S-methyltransferase n=1 Tax=Hymenobacter sp. CRA2 TaxID=1955620 RepID=UPI0009901AF6|nr:methylated-DNA--[protein]-cysteine S-methyltransferase [Hymenobacter sp. CRA2]OON70025.1 hypothetical protein B0919_04565 [Hymenobacter sp. CRA2]